MATIFIIGATGHLGGALLDHLQHTHPATPIRALARTDEKAALLRAQHPALQTVTGDLSSLPLLQAEARAADVVINCAPDITHDDGIRAALEGLRQRNDPPGGNGTGSAQKGYYIQTSGAATFYGEPDGARGGRVWDDVQDIQEIVNTDPSRTHMATDNLVRSYHPAVNVAIVSPPGIGGISNSNSNAVGGRQRACRPFPLVTPVLHSTARAFGSGFQIARGENVSGWVHVLDLARAFGVLVDDALGGGEARAPLAGSPLWGPEAYYFVSGEEVSFHDLQEAVVPVLRRHGVIASEEIRSVTHVEAARTCLAGGTEYDPDAPLPPPDSWVIHLATWFGVNMRIRPSRLLALGWRPRERSTLEAWEEAFALYLKGLEG